MKGFHYLLLVVLSPFVISVAAQIPTLKSVPEGLPPEQREALEQQRTALLERRNTIRSKIESHNQKCRNVPAGTSLAEECGRNQAQLEVEKAAYVSSARDFNDKVEQAERSLKEADRVLEKEQEEFQAMNDVWLRKQQDLVRQAVEGDNQWRSEVIASIKEIRVPNPTFRPKTLSDLKPGDILLITPEVGDPTSGAIPPADRFYRAVVNLAEGQVFKDSSQAPASHAVTFVKAVGGKMLFLDHTSVGSRILDEKQFEQQYGHRGMSIARPQAVVDGKKLWEAAREAALKRKSDYGIFGQKAVCSERAGMAVAKATGLPLENNRLGPIDITPGDFFDRESSGKYFVVSPLQR